MGNTIHIELDPAKQARIRSRAAFGPLRVGTGRKTSFKDRKKEANKKACRSKAEE
jgi:hypothetical protein